jgi:glutamate carboxypeptidase
MHGSKLLEYLRPRRDAMLASLRPLVEHESPSRDKAALDALARVLAGRLTTVGGRVEVLPNSAGGDHVLARFGPETSAASGTRPALILCHFDTVWPVGTLERQPFRVAGEYAFGPGIFDMKASLVLVESALSAIRALEFRLPREVVVLFTSDEEIGSPTSRTMIEALGRESDHVLVLEAPLPGGRVKTARKGVGLFVVEVAGKAAHAGVEPEKGINAINELALQVPRINALANPEAGTTLNVGRIEGGTTTNVVPARAAAYVDARSCSLDEARRVEEGFRSLTPITPGASIVVSGGFNRPPMERSPAVLGLFERVRAIGRSLGLELTEGSTGGGSDGNFTAALGIATLDGLGTLGAGAHAIDERIVIDSLPERAALLAALLLEL